MCRLKWRALVDWLMIIGVVGRGLGGVVVGVGWGSWRPAHVWLLLNTLMGAWGTH